MKRSVAAAILASTLSVCGAVVYAATGEIVYTDAATGMCFPQQIPPMTVAYPNATKTQWSTGTNTVSTTDIATTTPQASLIPMAGTDGKIDNGWIKTGTGTNQVVTGADPRLTDGRTSTDTLYTMEPVRVSIGTSTTVGTSAAVASSPKISINTGTATNQVIMGSDSRLSDDRVARGLRNASGVVDVYGAAAPSTGQVLKATSASAATWQTLGPTDVGAVPASAISGVYNYVAKFGASGASLGNSKFFDDGIPSVELNASTTTYPLTTLSQLNGGYIRLVPGTLYGDVNTSIGIVGRSALDGITTSAMIFRRFGATWESAIDYYVHPSGTSDLYQMYLALTLNQSGATFTDDVSAKSIKIRGATTGIVTHGVAATTASYSMIAPSTAPGATQAIQYPAGGGQGTWFTPLASTGVNYSGCTTTSSTGGVVTACDTTARVPDSRTVTCGNGLSQTGGPALSSNVTCYVSNVDGSINVGADTISVGTINDTQHGNRGGGSLHSLATVSTSGFMSAADYSKLVGFSGMSSSTPVAPGFTTPSAGTSQYAARYDHRHPDVIDLVYAGANNQYFQPPTIYAGTPTVLLEFPVYWLNMPSSLAVWATWTYENRGSATTCYLSLYTGSDVRGTLGGTTMFPYTTTSVPVGNSFYMENTAYTFTKPTNGSNGTRSRVQVYTYCASGSSVVLNDMHIHITGAN